MLTHRSTGALTHDSISLVCSFYVLKVMPERGAVQIVKSCTCPLCRLQYLPRLLDDEDCDTALNVTAESLTVPNKFGSSWTACAEENVSSLLLLFFLIVSACVSSLGVSRFIWFVVTVMFISVLRNTEALKFDSWFLNFFLRIPSSWWLIPHLLFSASFVCLFVYLFPCFCSVHLGVFRVWCNFLLWDLGTIRAAAQHYIREHLYHTNTNAIILVILVFIFL